MNFEYSEMDFVDLGANFIDSGANFVDMGAGFVGLKMGSGDLGMNFVDLEMNFMDSGANFMDSGAGFVFLKVGSRDLGMNFIDLEMDFVRDERYVIWMVPENRRTQEMDLEWSPVSSWTGSIDSYGQGMGSYALLIMCSKDVLPAYFNTE
ncbi:hypothetical protein CQW23_16932 [Capsicum baccatum]|uniref:Uncharacterized protein n=1 Tax=Capsicum baccatum TaxID=33114 RepID=A0A2G2WCF6_CAPBA|nr:hypothetical protein CQW23_16932 [Capsicum baccatum]